MTELENAAIGIIAFGFLAITGSVVGMIASQGPIVGVIGLIGIDLIIRVVTLPARLKREEANSPLD